MDGTGGGSQSNATGKTRLSVAYKDVTKQEKQHTGVYYNAFSEDIFSWDNDTENNEENIQLLVRESSLNRFHSSITEEELYKKLKPFKIKYDFDFVPYADPEKGIESIFFYIPDDEDKKRIKISRGEERIFIWCFFLALFEVEGWADRQSSHFFIDDPVSSLDDHNIFVTASTIFDLIEKHHEHRKIIITTHHFGFFSVLGNWLKKGEKSVKFGKKTKLHILSLKSGELTLESERQDVFLYHLHLLQLLENAQKLELGKTSDEKPESQLRAYHFALLRQVLENISSFLGVGRTSYVLEKIGIEDAERVTNIVNFLSHEKVYHFSSDKMNDDNEALFREIFGRIKNTYNFVLHSE